MTEVSRAVRFNYLHQIVDINYITFFCLRTINLVLPEACYQVPITIFMGNMWIFSPTLYIMEGLFPKTNPPMQIRVLLVNKSYPLIALMPILISPQIYWLSYRNIVSQWGVFPGYITMGNRIIQPYFSTYHQLLSNKGFLNQTPPMHLLWRVD